MAGDCGRLRTHLLDGVEQVERAAHVHVERELRDPSEDTIGAADAHRVEQILRQPKGDPLGSLKIQSVVEHARKVDVHQHPRRRVDKDVLEVPISEADREADHRHDGTRARERQPRLEPRGWIAKRVDKPVVQHRWQLGHELHKSLERWQKQRELDAQ